MNTNENVEIGLPKSDVNSDVDSPTLNGGVTGWRESKTDNGKLILFVQS
ncbi:unnamed protein product [Enterobius vermicularis]|uniref:Uncharacterized protein n=1 Tax=Enterobius vermicularis TaxID=51028 RepID=A0A0N4V9C0_ENTVE|nr:unnamed protein product [Enterobius vermicularis]